MLNHRNIYNIKNETAMDGIKDCKTLETISGIDDPIVPPINAPIKAIINAPQKLPRNFILKTKIETVAAVVALIKYISAIFIK